MIPNCFQIYFNPVYIYCKRVFMLAIVNDYEIAKFSFSITAFMQMGLYLFKLDAFGVPNFLLLLVIATVLVDAYYGIMKSKKQSKESAALAVEYEEGTPERRMYIRTSEVQKFNPKKLQFTFFKCFTLLAYLYVAKHILEVQQDDTTLAGIIGFASGVVTKAPLAIFWYYDFKSIGDNSAYVFGKKAPIFTIVEKIFEPKLKVFLDTDKKE